jgi:hypothetical protein
LDTPRPQKLNFERLTLVLWHMREYGVAARFAMTDREFENYLALLSGLLKLSKSQREAIARELADHLDERLSALLEQGVSREDAVTMALEEFGDVAQLASALSRSGRRQQRRWMMRLTMSSLAAVAALVFVAMALWPDRDAGPAPERAVAQAAAEPDPAEQEPPARAVTPETLNLVVDARPAVTAVVAGGHSRDDQLNEQTEVKLRTLIPAEFVDTPLNDVLTQLGKRLDVQTYIDRGALEAATIDPSVPVTIELQSVPTDMLLELILGQLQLTYVIRSGIIIVTTEEEAQADLVVRVYNVNDLLMPAADTGPFLDQSALDELTRRAGLPQTVEAWEELKQALTKKLNESHTRVSTYQKRVDQLIELITSSIAQDTWEDVGGDGSITFYRGAIVVSQTSEVHRQIAKLLPELRAATAKNPDIPCSPTDKSQKDQQPQRI